jgi:hypothetical protein
VSAHPSATPPHYHSVALNLINSVGETECRKGTRQVRCFWIKLFRWIKCSFFAKSFSAGFYFGFVESSLIAAANALGLTKVAADLAYGMMASSGEDSIRNENMYFLWKIRQRAERA